MRLLITGSRDWEGIHAESEVGQVLTTFEMLCAVLGEELQLMHGGCPTGADAIADRWARRRGYEPVVFEAKWDLYGKSAGPIRNSAMAEFGADACVAFIRNDSRGTTDMVAKAVKKGIWTTSILWDPAWGPAASSPR
jgi:hypothetical protein